MSLSFPGDFCGTEIQRLRGDLWETVWRSDSTGCVFSLSVLKPHGTIPFLFEIPQSFEQGTYRLIFPAPYVERGTEQLDEPAIIGGPFSVVSG
jgi:hypothetical protein